MEAFRNIIGNAVEAMDSGGALTIAVDLESIRYPRVVIADTGQGIPDEAKRKIFQAGFSSKREGKGIGLWFTRKSIVDYHQGRIDFDSQEGRGTTFTILLPLRSSSTSSEEGIRARRWSMAKILIADNQLEWLTLHDRRFKMKGMRW